MDTCDKETFEESIFETFETKLSDGTTKELIHNGKNIEVTYENRKEFITRVIEAKVNESKLQIEAIKKGIYKLIPDPLMFCLSASDL